jgi:exosortase A
MKRDLEFAPPHASVRALLKSRSLYAVALAVAAILAVYWTTAVSIVAIWIRSETFAHGFVIIPICGWLAWRKRDELAVIATRPWWPGSLVVLLAGTLWFVASKAGAVVVQQFALAFMLQGACVTIIGLAAARVLAFPLAFLLFAVPAGEFLVPTLMDWTAYFTVNALRATGVPVYREANFFVIPSGAWSVVEACSGVRYIIASLMVGTIYAAVAYRSAGRRAVFILASITVPIVANWLRAYMIVLLGHLSNNRIATGIDHIIYGWIFFGLVMLLLFWIASFWQEAGGIKKGEAQWAAETAAMNSASFAPLACALMLAVAAAVVWRPVDALVGARVAQGTPVLPKMKGAAGWSVSSGHAEWAPHYEGYAADLWQTFTDGSRDVDVYMAYDSKQTKGHELITSVNVLAEARGWKWKQVDQGHDEVEWNGRRTTVNRSDLVGQQDRIRVFSLYWIGGSVTSSAYMAKALQAWSNLRGHGDDAALVTIYTSTASDDDAATRTLHDFAEAMSPSIQTALRGAQETGR